MRNVRSIQVLLLTAIAASCTPADERGTDPLMEGEASYVDMPMTSMTQEGELKQALRELWADHVIWTRDYIIAATSDHPSAEAALARLMTNQEDLGHAIAPYYGTEAGSGLTALLKDHISIAGEVVAAAKAGNTHDLDLADQRWHDNAAQIATFLSDANPNWSRDDLVMMLNEHLALTTQEATARLEGNWADDAASFDSIFAQAMMMADALAEGIMKQFPQGTTS